MKKKDKKVGFMQGVASLMFSQILIKVLGLVYTMYLTNKKGYGDLGNGISAGAYNLYALLLTISSIGVPAAISKLIAERETLGDVKGINRIFNISLVTFGCLGFIGSCILFFGANNLANNYLQVPDSSYTLVALSPAVFIVSVASVFRGYFNGRQRLQITAKSQSLEQIYKCVFTLVLVELIGIYTNLDTKLMAAGANLATTLSTLMGMLYLWHFYNIIKKEQIKEKDIKLQTQKQEKIKVEVVGENSSSYEKKSLMYILKQIFIVSIPITLTAIMTSINKNIDSVTVVSGLKHFLTETEATKLFGILNWKVDTLTNLPLALNIAFSTALVPAIASAKAKKDNKQITSKSSTLLLFSMLIALPCAIGMIVLADPILKMLFPAQPDGSLVLQISAIAIVFTVLGQTLNSILQGYGKLYVPIIALFIRLVAKYIINITLIPNSFFGINGAAIGSDVCQIIAFVIAMISVKKCIKLDLSFSNFILKPFLSAILMGAFAYLSFTFLNPVLGNTKSCLIAIVIAIIVYLASIIAFRILTKEQILQLPQGNKILRFLNRFNIYT